MASTKTAIVSVYDKTGIVDFCKALVAAGWTVISTGGTEKALREAEVKVTAVSDVTAFPEILGGRVKTLHPAVRKIGRPFCLTACASHLSLVPSFHRLWLYEDLG